MREKEIIQPMQSPWGYTSISCSDPHANCVHIETQCPENMIEGNTVFHAIATASSIISDNFLENNLGV